MNYRHIYHAGNFADVFKHLVLCTLLKQLRDKNKPFCYIDSHAGIGLYDLHSNETQRSLEYNQGIVKLLEANATSPLFSTYTSIIKAINTPITLEDANSISNLRYYPGSPLIAAHFLKEQDNIILNELHDEDFLTLKKNTQHLPQVSCHKRHAYEFLPAILPPTPRRALILIDPPYEKRDEYNNIVIALKKSLKKFATGIYLIWYPIVDDSHQTLLRRIQTAVAQPLIHHKIMCRNKSSGLIGSGVAIINPPWKADDAIQQLVSQLTDLF